MSDEPRFGKYVPGSVKALLALIAIILLLGLLVGIALTAIGPSQDPNHASAAPLAPLASAPV